MIELAKKIIGWVQRNERHLSTPLFIAGFVNDVLTVGNVPFSYALVLFGVYLTIAAVATIAGHYFYAHDESGAPEDVHVAHWDFPHTIRVLLSLLAQFVTGGLLSGCLIFYTKGAALSASWPFILLLVVVFVGNEFFRLYRDRLAFRAILFFFTLYAYTIFALPTITHTIDAMTFVASTAISVAISIVFLIALALAGWRRFKASLTEIVIGIVIVATLVNVSYFTGIIPPLPLSLRNAGVYHSVTHTGDGYAVASEPTVQPWWDFDGLLDEFVPQTVHYVPGSALSVYSAVFAPISFSTGIVHRWQWYDESHHKWVTKAEIAFSIAGGRDGGYRGYSTLSSITPGKYRVSIETLSGQIIGRIAFRVVDADSASATITQIK